MKRGAEGAGDTGKGKAAAADPPSALDAYALMGNAREAAPQARRRLCVAKSIFVTSSASRPRENRLTAREERRRASQAAAVSALGIQLPVTSRQEEDNAAAAKDAPIVASNNLQV